jgi:hypothetical protein
MSSRRLSDREFRKLYTSVFEGWSSTANPYCPHNMVSQWLLLVGLIVEKLCSHVCYRTTPSSHAGRFNLHERTGVDCIRQEESVIVRSHSVILGPAPGHSSGDKGNGRVLAQTFVCWSAMGPTVR